MKALYRLLTAVAALCVAFGALAGTAVFAEGGSVSGMVTDADGNRLPDARVSLSDGAGAAASGVTDEDGVFCLTGVSGGTYTIQAELDGYNTAEQSAEVSGSLEGLVLVLVSQQGIHEDFAGMEPGRNLDSPEGALPWMTTSTNSGKNGTILIDELDGKNVVHLTDLVDDTSFNSPEFKAAVGDMAGKSYIEFSVRSRGNMYFKAYARTSSGARVQITNLTFTIDVNNKANKQIVTYDTDSVTNKIPTASYQYKDDVWYTIRMDFDSESAYYDLSVTSEDFKTISDSEPIMGANASLDRETGTYKRTGVPYYRGLTDAAGGICDIEIKQGKLDNDSYIGGFYAQPVPQPCVRSRKLYCGGENVTEAEAKPQGTDQIRLGLNVYGGERLDETTFTTDQIQIVRDGADTPLEFTPAYDPETRFLDLSLGEVLDYNAAYTMTVDGILTQSGQRIEEWTDTFRTAARPLQITGGSYQCGGRTVTALNGLKPGDQLSARLQYSKTAAAPQNAYLILAAFRDGCLAEVSGKPVNIAAGETSGTLETGALVLPADFDGRYTYRAFIWDDAESQKSIYSMEPVSMQ